MTAGAWADYGRVLERLSDSHQDDLGDALDALPAAEYWSSRRRGEWLYKEAVRRGLVLGPA